MKTWTHAELVARGARWAKNTYGCKVVLTENESYTGETPDVIGWKANGRSIMIECKTSRSDFLADAKKPFRQNPVLALGAERYYMVPAGSRIIDHTHDSLTADWGLLEARGNGVKVIFPARPRKDLRSDQARNYEMRMLITTLGRVANRLEPAQLNEWLAYEHRNTSATEMQNWVSKEDHVLYLAAAEGFELVVDPADLPTDDATGEPWCPKHEMVFAECQCIPPHDQLTTYREVMGHQMAKRIPYSQPDGPICMAV